MIWFSSVHRAAVRSAMPLIMLVIRASSLNSAVWHGFGARPPCSSHVRDEHAVLHLMSDTERMSLLVGDGTVPL
ncbi:hypothetical protein ABT329_42240, partial [Streptomyces minutiscleroticus]